MIKAIVVLVLLVWLVRRGMVGYPPVPPGLALLNRGEAAFVDAAADVLFPGGFGLPVAGIDAHLPHYVDRYLAALPRAKRLQIRALFLLMEHFPLFVPANEPGGRQRFSSQTAAARASILEQLSKHRSGALRTLFQALRAVLVLGYLGHPENLNGVGLAPFAIDRAVSDAELLFPRIGGLVSSIGHTLADRTVDTPGAPLDPHGPRDRAYARASRDSR